MQITCISLAGKSASYIMLNIHEVSDMRVMREGSNRGQSEGVEWEEEEGGGGGRRWGRGEGGGGG